MFGHADRSVGTQSPVAVGGHGGGVAEAVLGAEHRPARQEQLRRCVFRDPGFGFRVQGFAFWVSGFGCRISGFKLLDSGFVVVFRASGFGLRGHVVLAAKM